jgi:hypothetical protein
VSILQISRHSALFFLAVEEGKGAYYSDQARRNDLGR